MNALHTRSNMAFKFAAVPSLQVAYMRYPSAQAGWKVLHPTLPVCKVQRAGGLHTSGLRL